MQFFCSHVMHCWNYGGQEVHARTPMSVWNESSMYLVFPEQGGRYPPQNPPVIPKTRTPRRPTWRTAKSTLVPYMINILWLMTFSRSRGSGGEAPGLRSRDKILCFDWSPPLFVEERVQTRRSRQTIVQKLCRNILFGQSNGKVGYVIQTWVSYDKRGI